MVDRSEFAWGKNVKQPGTVALRIAAVVIAVWILWGLIGPFLTSLKYKWKFESLGQWADSFGALNALFAALGFSAVIYTLLLQQKQNLSVERDQHKQRFESSFFELLRLLREARNEVRYIVSLEFETTSKEFSRKEIAGVPAFRAAWKEARHFIEAENALVDGMRAGEIYYDAVHKRFESNLGPYYRLLYTILRRIDEDSVLSEKEKASYGNILRTQLTSYELALVALNGKCLVSNNFSSYITKYHLLKYLPENSARRRLIKQYYPETAFEGRD